MNNTLKRAIRTFFQAALGYLVAALGGGIAGLYDAEGRISKVALGGLVVSAVAAGLAALMNLPSAEIAPDVEEIYGARETGRADCASDAAFADPARIDLFDGDRVTGETGEGRGDE